MPVATSELPGRDISVIRKSPFAFKTVKEYDEMVKGKTSGRPTVRTYLRYSGPEIWEQEQKIAGLIGIDPNRLYLTNSGMGAYNLALYSAGLRTEDTILRGEQLYPGMHRSLQKTADKLGAHVVQVNAGSIDDIEQGIKSERPKVLLFDVVGNGSEMTVASVKDILNSDVVHEANPFIIFDNTLPNVDFPLPALLQEEGARGLRAIGIESGTKAHFCNQDTLGIVYVGNEALLPEIFTDRTELGYTPSVHSMAALSKYIAPSPEQLRRELTTANKNTLTLARAVANSSGAGRLFDVYYPNLEEHRNYEAANAIAPNGIAPVIYLDQSPFKSYPIPPRRIAEIFEERGLIGDNVLFGESFLFNEHMVSYTDHFVRISGGQMSSDRTTEVAGQLQEILNGPMV